MQKLSKISLWVIGISVFLMFLISLLPESEEDAGPQEYEVDKTLACIIAQDFVKQRLKSPKSAEFPPCRDISIDYLGNKTYEVSGYVDSQNSFGALLRTDYYVRLTDLGETWKAEEVIIE